VNIKVQKVKGHNARYSDCIDSNRGDFLDRKNYNLKTKLPKERVAVKISEVGCNNGSCYLCSKCAAEKLSRALVMIDQYIDKERLEE